MTMPIKFRSNLRDKVKKGNGLLGHFNLEMLIWFSKLINQITGNHNNLIEQNKSDQFQSININCQNLSQGGFMEQSIIIC